MNLHHPDKLLFYYPVLQDVFEVWKYVDLGTSIHSVSADFKMMIVKTQLLNYFANRGIIFQTLVGQISFSELFFSSAFEGMGNLHLTPEKERH